MADNKNQHFVPRCYLRPFTAGGENVAINLFNLDRAHAINGAPVKNQCSKNYFYGRNPLLEAAINTVENHYADCYRTLWEDGVRTDAKVDITLKRFILLQSLRTEQASRRAAEMTFAMHDVPGVDAPLPSFRDAVHGAVQAAMETYRDIMGIIDDLKLCLIINETSTPFVTSDNPAILTNRWHLNNPRCRHRSFGARHAGALFIMPMAPGLLALLYDRHIYSIAQRGGVLVVRDPNDIDTLNAHQVLNCAANLYFENWADAPAVTELAAKVATRRPAQAHEVRHLVFDKQVGNHKRYEIRDRSELKAGQETMVHVLTNRPNPGAWPSFLKRHRDGKAYSNNTGAGFTRLGCLQAGYVSGAGYRKVRA